MQADNEKGVGDVANSWMGTSHVSRAAAGGQAQPEPSDGQWEARMLEVVLVRQCWAPRPVLLSVLTEKRCCVVGKDSEKSNKCDQILEIWRY